MPRVIVTEEVRSGLRRCRHFREDKNPRAAIRAGQAIARSFLMLETAPGIGQPVDEWPELRELIIGFGDSGYVALYRHEPGDEAVTLLAFRHQKEAGY